MKRTLPLAMLISLVAASPIAQALGLANPQVQSSLNEPLQARIALTDLRGLDPTLLKARLADEAAFEQAGLPRSALAESVRMALERGAGGLQLVLSTERAVREPYLDLLVTLFWPGGQQRRQVTLLFDPPGYASAPALIDGAQVTESTRQAQVIATPLDSPSESTPPSQVRVQPGDTLWGLAMRVRPSADISIDQAMLALLQANPEAFPDGNINGLRAGAILAVPSRQIMLSSTQAEAVSRVQSQNQAWRGNDDLERSVAVTEVGVGTAQERQPPEPQAAERQTSAASNDAQPRLTLLSDADLAAERSGTTDMPDTSADSAAQQQLSQLMQNWQASRESLARGREERERLQSEIVTLRQDIAELREMLLAASTPEPIEPEPISVAVPETASEAVAKPETAREAAAPAGPSPSSSPSNNANGDTHSGGFWQMLNDNSLSIAGVAIALLLALWALVRRRNTDDHVREGVGFPLGAGSIDGGVTSPSPTPTSTPAASTPLSQSPAMKESTPDTPPGSASQADVPRASAPQAETISEADILIAYGRFDQARELLRQGLDNDPERHDLRLKLLTVHVELGELEDAQREAARMEAADEPDYHDEVRRLMSRFNGIVEEHDDASHGLGEDEMPEEENGQVEETDTASRGYIEYEPPSLDSSHTDRSAKEPDKRQEAFQQPGIDYPGSLGGNGDDVDEDEDELEASIDVSEEMPRRSASVEHDWEVEEVAFEPLNLDNETPNPGSNRAP